MGCILIFGGILVPSRKLLQLMERVLSSCKKSLHKWKGSFGRAPYCFSEQGKGVVFCQMLGDHPMAWLLCKQEGTSNLQKLGELGFLFFFHLQSFAQHPTLFSLTFRTSFSRGYQELQRQGRGKAPFFEWNKIHGVQCPSRIFINKCEILKKRNLKILKTHGLNEVYILEEQSFPLIYILN